MKHPIVTAVARASLAIALCLCAGGALAGDSNAIERSPNKDISPTKTAGG
jgi:hypothetical protein